VKRFKVTSKAQIVNVIFMTDGESNPAYGVIGHQQNVFSTKRKVYSAR
jgi:hypothetical protein